MRKLLVGEKGAAIIEFALVLPLLIIIISGAIEFGLVMYNKQVITNASREGARAGIVYQTPRVTDDAIKQEVQYYTANQLVTFGEDQKTLDPNDIDIVHPAEPVTGDDLTVTVTYRYTFLVISNFIPGLGNLLELTARTVMKYE